MIDTIALKLTSKEFKILNYSRFRFDGFNGQSSYSKAFYNTDPKTFGYSLKLTLYRRFGNEELKIECSAPKCLRGNNFDELDDQDFEPLVRKLAFDLYSLDVQVYQWNLRNAEVSKIDFSKNIILTNGTKSRTIINELYKANISKRLDINKTVYRNGDNLQFHANSYEYVFYDKVADLKQAKISEKRAYEEDNSMQLNLLDHIKDDPFEVFRIEIRLANRAKIKHILKKLNLPETMTFQSLFKQEVSKAILGHFWNETVECLSLATIRDSDTICVLDKVLQSKQFTFGRALALVAAMEIIRDEGARRFFKLAEKRTSDRTLSDYKRDIKGLTKILPKNTKVKAILRISDLLNSFEKTELKNYPQLSV